jgi:hypothetical protein
MDNSVPSKILDIEAIFASGKSLCTSIGTSSSVTSAYMITLCSHVIRLKELIVLIFTLIRNTGLVFPYPFNFCRS